MPAVVSPYWSKEQYQRGERASKSYLVASVADADAASVAVPYQKNSTHPLDSRLVAEQPELVSQPGPLAFEIQVRFVKQENVNPGTGGGGEQPLDLPLVWKWNPGTTIEAFTHDIEGNPLLNSAGRPYNPPPTKEINTLFLEVERNESSFDVSVSIAYQGAINSNNFSVKTGNGQTQTVEPGQARLVSYAPMQFYNESTPYVRSRYLIEMRDYFEGVSADPEYKSSFQWRLLDQGTDGWGTFAGVTLPGKIMDGEGAVNTDVLLDGTGRPLSSLYKVYGQAPVANPLGFPTGAVLDTQSSSRNMLYRRYKFLSFSGLNLG